MKFILGKKIEMTQIFEEDGTVMPVTQVKAGPCTVTQVKNQDGQDGYNAVQIGFGQKKKLSKALKGHLKDLEDFRYLREFSLASKDELGELKRGDKITAATFEAGETVKVIGKSKGRGFQGVVKRHGFHGSPASHGHKDQLRAPGSIGATEPARVFSGKKMPGHMGDTQVTVKNLTIVKVDPQNNILYIKGAVPGARNGLLMISGDGELKINTTINQTNNKTTEDQEKTDSVETRFIASKDGDGANDQEQTDTVETPHRDVVGAQEKTDIKDSKDASQSADGASQGQEQASNQEKPEHKTN